MNENTDLLKSIQRAESKKKKDLKYKIKFLISDFCFLVFFRRTDLLIVQDHHERKHRSVEIDSTSRK